MILKRFSSLAASVAVLATVVPSAGTAAIGDAFFGDPLLESDAGPRRLNRGRAFGTARFDVDVTNTSSKTVAGPLRVAVDVNRQVLNADGVTEDGVPYFDVCGDCSLAPGETSDAIRVRYRTPSFFELLFGLVRPFSVETEAQYLPYTIQFLHNADVDGVGPLANARNFSGLLDALRAEAPDQTLYVTSGDNWIPGPAYAAGEDATLAGLLGVPGRGRGDIAILNAMGAQASAIGNHELDEGLAVFGGIIGVDGGWEGAQFPYLASNIDFTGTAVEPLTVPGAFPALPNTVAPSAVVTVDGELIGIVGISGPTFPQITSTEDAVVSPPLLGGGAIDVPAVAAIVQASIDELTGMGIDKIVVLSHMQVLDVERAFAPLLTGADIIVGGGSNTILADGTDLIRPGDTVGGPYPELYVSPNGAPVSLVNTDGDYKYLGRQVVAFDLSGEIITASLDESVNGAYATDDASLQTILGAVPAPNATVDAVVTGLENVLIASEGNFFGFTDVYLDGRRATVRTQESNMGNLTADANLFVARQADPTVAFSLKNGGGIRDDIGEIVFPPGSSDPDDVQFLPTAEIPGIKPAGAISQFDISNTLRFNNSLALLTLTAQEVVDIFEHAVNFDVVGESQQGRFPQVGGIRVEYDLSAPAGHTPGSAPQRVLNLDLVDTNGAITETIVDAGVLVSASSYRMVTLGFLAGGGDGYPFPATSDPAASFLDLEDDPSSLPAGVASFAPAGSEQDALAEYLSVVHPTPATAFDEAEVPADQDDRIVLLP